MNKVHGLMERKIDKVGNILVCHVVLNTLTVLAPIAKILICNVNIYKNSWYLEWNEHGCGQKASFGIYIYIWLYAHAALALRIIAV